jgi:hypothetical protein
LVENSLEVVKEENHSEKTTAKDKSAKSNQIAPSKQNIVGQKTIHEGRSYDVKKAKDSYFFKSGLLMQFSQVILCSIL